MDFSLQDFKESQYRYPRYFHTLYSVDRKLYNNMQQSSQNKGVAVSGTLSALKARTPHSYFRDMNRAQTSALDYSEYIFPAYKFLMPDVLMDDWLSIVDPHKSGKRDHSLHQPLTAYIVCKLLGFGDSSKSLTVNGVNLLNFCATQLLKSPKMSYLREYFSELYPKRISLDARTMQMMAEHVFYQASVTAALFHDIGYPWQYVNKIGEGINLSNMSVPALDIYAEIADRLLLKPFLGYPLHANQQPVNTHKEEIIGLLSTAYSNTHGFPGAIAFQNLNDGVIRHHKPLSLNDAICRFIQDYATVGILMHDMFRQHDKMKKEGDTLFRLHIDVDPLSCLIALSDILEEFARPVGNFSSATSKVDLQFVSPCKKTSIDVISGIMTITYTYIYRQYAQNNRTWRKEEVDGYLNGADSFIDLSAFGIVGGQSITK